MNELNIAEIPYETGEIHYRYSRYLAPDRSRWIRHGLFRAYYKNGQLASEGTYRDGLEDGPWCDYHENGQIAAKGSYQNGQEGADWTFWNSDGTPSAERPG